MAPFSSLQTMIAARRITSLEPDLLSVSPGITPQATASLTSHGSSQVERPPQRQLNPKQPQLETCGIRIIGVSRDAPLRVIVDSFLLGEQLAESNPHDLVIKGLASIDGKVPVMFTIDALDECPAEEARILFRILRGLLSSTEHPVYHPVYAVAQ
ncbi:hypothetical protein F5887DRAFT_1157821, partial [Amanita rubescens]